MAQIIRITSEALQATIRRLLPSQQGFGEDLQASNVIQPIIDLTPTAEGSILRQDLQTAVNATDATVFSVQGTTTTVFSTPGFLRIFGCVSVNAGTGAQFAEINLGGKTIWALNTLGVSGQNNTVTQSFDLTAFIASGSGDSLILNMSSNAIARGSVRQIADANANLVNPTGLTVE